MGAMILDANSAGSEEPRTQSQSLRVMSDSDVNSETKSMDNAGRASGAGLVSGASLGRRSASIPEVWESGLSRSRRTR